MALQDLSTRRPGRRSRAAAPVNRWLTLAVLCVPLVMISLDNTVLNVVLPTLVRTLHATDSELQWIVDSYVLVFGGLMLVSGSLGDRVGRKRTFLAGLVVFAACSTWAAFSGSAGVLIAARASMGLGATLVMPATLAIITATFSDRTERQRALGIWAGMTGAGVALGPIVGGLLLAHFAWGSVFLINVPIAVLGIAAGIRLVPDSRNEHAQPPDVLGSLLSVVGLGLVLWAIIEAPTRGWRSTEVIAAGATGLASLTAFVVWETRTSHPMLRLEFFRRRAFTGAVLSMATAMFSLMGTLFVLTQFLQFKLAETPLQAGIHMLPAAGCIAVVAPLSATVVRRLGIKLTVTAGLALVTGALWGLSRASVSTGYSGVLVSVILLGVGVGLTMPAAVGSLMSTLPTEHTGIGAATNGSFQNLGGALGVAIIGSTMATRYQHRITALAATLPAHAAHAVLGSLGGALAIAHGLGGRAGARLVAIAEAAFMSGMSDALLIGALVVLGGVLLAATILPFGPPSEQPSGSEPPSAERPRRLMGPSAVRSEKRRLSRQKSDPPGIGPARSQGRPPAGPRR